MNLTTSYFDKRLQELADIIHKEGNRIVAILDNLSAEIARQTDIDRRVMQKLDDLIAQIAALSQLPVVDPAQLQALVDQIKANDDTLEAKVSPTAP